jgi:hypothetical protein
MCWNFEVSIGFGLIHLVTLLIVWKCKPEYYRQLMIFLSFYIIMEWFQAGQWHLGLYHPNYSYGCTRYNTYMTIFAYILIWIQPIMYSSFTSEKFPLYYSWMTFIIAMINLILGMNYPADEMIYLTWKGQTNYGYRTCSYKGTYGHILWKFSVNTISYQPTHYVYYSIILLTILFYYNRILQLTIGIGWLGSLIATIIIHGVNNELPAFWCLMSCLADIPIVVYCLKSYFLTKK